MPPWTTDEITLIYLHHTDTRQHTLSDLQLLLEALDEDEVALAQLIQSATEKLQIVSDSEYDQLIESMNPFDL